MARNNPKPGGKVDWDATGNIVEPNAGRKTSGWLFNVKPPAQNFNWLWNLLGLQQFYSNAQVEDWIVIDSDADERDYATLTAYLADAPAAGDRILIKEDQTVTVQTVIPDDITLKFLDGSRLLCATNIATSVLQVGSNIIVEGVLKIVLSQPGTTDKAVEYNGDNVKGIIDVENASTGTLTTAHSINSGKTGNQTEGIAINSGGGALTNIGIDNSTEDSNNIQIVDDSNNQVWRSRGAYKFRDGFEFDLGSDANGDIYYRDAGILKRLPKGSDGQVLELSSGIPAWTTPPLTQSFTSAEQVISVAGGLSLAHGLPATPYLIMPYLICKTAELGYSIGDEVLINPAGNDPNGTVERGISIVPDGTNVNVRYGAATFVIGIMRKDTGQSANITLANWKLIIRTWA